MIRPTTKAPAASAALRQSPLRQSSLRRAFWRRASLQGLLVAAALILPLATAACDSSTEPSFDELRVSAELGPGERMSHPFTLTDRGAIRFELESIDAVFDEDEGEEGQQPPTLSLTVSVGQPVQGSCATSHSFPLFLGDFELVALPEGDYCVLVSERGILDEDEVITYTVVLSGL